MPKTARFSTNADDLRNGEREVSTSISDFPRDHLARYEFASAFLTPDHNVLDVGCGVGYGSHMLAGFAKHVTSMDLRPHAIEYARHHWSGNNQTFLVGDATDGNSYPNERYSLITAFEIIEHVRNDGVLLAHIANHLETDGLLVASVPNLNISLPDDNPWHYRHYTPVHFRDLLRSQFKHVSLFGVGQDRVVPDTARHSIVAVAYNQWTRFFRIGFVSQEYPASATIPDQVPPSGGIGTYTKIVASELARLGHHVEVVSRSLNTNFSYMDNGVLVHRLTDTPLPSQHPANRWGVTSGLLARARAVERFLSQEAGKYDIVEAAEWRAETVLAWRKRPQCDQQLRVTRLHTPTHIVHEASGIRQTSRDLQILQWLEKVNAHLAIAVTSPSRALASRCKHDWRLQNIVVTPNPIGISSANLTTNAGLTLEIGYFPGRLDTYKGFPVLSEGLRQLAAEQNGRLGFHLSLTGTDYASAECLNALGQLQNLVLAGELTALPRQPLEVTTSLIERSDCIVLASRFENSPYVMLEAMAHGKLVIAPRVGGIPETITDGLNGLLFDTNDPASLADAFRRLLNFDSQALLRLRANAKNTIIEKHDLAQTADALQVYYAYLRGSRRRKRRPFAWWTPTRGPLIPQWLRQWKTRLWR